jgi:hypothetical protein
VANYETIKSAKRRSKVKKNPHDAYDCGQTRRPLRIEIASHRSRTVCRTSIVSACDEYVRSMISNSKHFTLQQLQPGDLSILKKKATKFKKTIKKKNQHQNQNQKLTNRNTNIIVAIEFAKNATIVNIPLWGKTTKPRGTDWTMRSTTQAN